MESFEMWYKMKEKLKQDIEFYKSGTVKVSDVDHVDIRLAECEAHLQYMIDMECEDDERISAIKEVYKSSDIVMSELLANEYYGKLTADEIKYLLNWSGDYDYIEDIDSYALDLAVPTIMIVDDNEYKVQRICGYLKSIMPIKHTIHKTGEYVSAARYIHDNMRDGKAKRYILLLDWSFPLRADRYPEAGMGHQLLSEIKRLGIDLKTIIVSSDKVDEDKINFPFVVGSIIDDASIHQKKQYEDLINKIMEERKNEQNSSNTSER